MGFVEKGALKTWDINLGYTSPCACISGVTEGSSESSNINLTQTMFTTTTSGSIPAGVQSYTIINLGINPEDPNSVVNSMIINGITLNNKFLTFSNSTDGSQILSNNITYNPNGNTLLIIYNKPVI